jgi:hypothetical protein
MVRNIILENLNHGNPTGLFVRDFGLSAQSHYIIIFDHRSNHKSHRIREDLGIRINLQLALFKIAKYHQYQIINIWRKSRNLPNPIKYLKLQFRHSFIKQDFLQE